jgi:hypothetical protein
MNSEDTHSMIRIKSALLEPPPLENLKELERLVEPKPNFVGPGPWLKILKKENGGSPGEKPHSGKEKKYADHRSQP